MSVFRRNMVKTEVWDNQGPYVLLYSPKNCEINHCFSSLMHVHLVKAQENNYPSLNVPDGSPQRTLLILQRRCGILPSTACSLSRHSNLARKAT